MKTENKQTKVGAMFGAMKQYYNVKEEKLNKTSFFFNLKLVFSFYKPLKDYFFSFSFLMKGKHIKTIIIYHIYEYLYENHLSLTAQ